MREIVLCAGTINTPQILLLSGIGPTADLTALEITTIIDNPSVGSNLSDHLLLANNFIVEEGSSYDDILRGGTPFTDTLDEWTTSQTGVFANGVANNLGFFRLPSDDSIFDTVPDPSTGPDAAHWELVVTVSSPTVALVSSLLTLPRHRTFGLTLVLRCQRLVTI